MADTARAAEALTATAARLERWTQAGIVTPVHVDPDGEAWWSVRDLRRQIASYLGDHDEN